MAGDRKYLHSISALTFAFIAVIASAILHPSPVLADPSDWLPPGSKTEFTGSPPQEYLTKGTSLKGQSLLGKLLFNSPSILGEKAVRIGLSCNSCHPSGHVNTGFHISGLSDESGSIDLSNRFWHKQSEDNIFNPIPIPSLRNVRNTAPYGINISLPTLVAFTRHVIMDEFGGPEPSNADMQALIGYMNLLEKQDSEDMSVQDKTIGFAPLIALLVDPVDALDGVELDRRIGLIKEELGRQATDTNRPQLATMIRQMKDIQGLLKSAPKAAKAAFDAFAKEAALN